MIKLLGPQRRSESAVIITWESEAHRPRECKFRGIPRKGSPDPDLCGFVIREHLIVHWSIYEAVPRLIDGPVNSSLSPTLSNFEIWIKRGLWRQVRGLGCREHEMNEHFKSLKPTVTSFHASTLLFKTGSHNHHTPLAAKASGRNVPCQ